jgi:hypothetical protein
VGGFDRLQAGGRLGSGIQIRVVLASQTAIGRPNGLQISARADLEDAVRILGYLCVELR